MTVGGADELMCPLGGLGSNSKPNPTLGEKHMRLDTALAYKRTNKKARKRYLGNVFHYVQKWGDATQTHRCISHQFPHEAI